MPKEAELCETCLFYDNNNYLRIRPEKYGKCRRYPPPKCSSNKHVNNLVDSQPAVKENDWCGEYVGHPLLRRLRAVKDTE